MQEADWRDLTAGKACYKNRFG